MSTRRALIIGNDNYAKNELYNCVNDAQDLAAVLNQVNYQVCLKTNLASVEMYNCFKQFTDSIQSADFILFYFAGHAVQWGDQNFLLPCDNNSIIDGDDMQRFAMNAQQRIDRMAEKKPHTIIFLLDCCRNYWVPTRTRAGEQSVGGLQQMTAPSGTLIAFACAPGKTISDESSNAKHGVFTKYLLKHITTPGIDVELMLRKVANDVTTETGHKQKPFRVSSIYEDNVCIIPKVLAQNFPLRCSSNLRISPKTRWKSNGVTVAGGNGEGNKMHQLSNPWGLFVDDEKTVYVADRNNSRIMEWKVDATSGRVVAGGNGPGRESHQLLSPYDVIVDKKRGSLIISNHGNEEVVRWPLRNRASGETIISNVRCFGLTMDENESLFVVGYGNAEVRRYASGDSRGIVVAGGNGHGNRSDQLNDPEYIFVDQDHSVYISDTINSRVVKWTADAKEGTVVAGGEGNRDSPLQLSSPHGIAVDSYGTIYIADFLNHRVIRWTENGRNVSIIAGGNGRGEESNQLRGPVGLSFDQEGNLYVADCGNHRVQRFDLIQ